MATSPSATPTPITPPRVPLIDERTGLIDRAWYLFFLSLFRASETIDSTTLGTNTESLIASYDAALMALAQIAETQPSQNDCCTEIDAVRQKVQTQPNLGVTELAQEVSDLRQEVQTTPRLQLGTFAALQQANLPWTTFDTTPQSVPETDTGTVYWSDDDATLNVVLESGVTGQVCQQLDFHPKNTSGVQINKGQAVMATGVVGSSTKITCAKAVANGSVPAQYMLGIAAQDIPANSFGYVVWFGSVRGFNTTGANKTVPEVWVDGDILYFDPVYPGELTKVEPFAPNLDLPIAIVTSVGNNGSIFVRMKTGETLDELHDVHAPTPANNDLLVYDSVDLRWENKNVTNTFNLSSLAANGVLYLDASKIASSSNLFTFSGGNLSLASGRFYINSASAALANVNILTGGQTGGIQLIRNASSTPTSGQSLGTYAWKGVDSANSNAASEAMIEAVAAENFTGSTAATSLLFYTKPTGTGPGSAPTERVRITSGGQFGIGFGGGFAALANLDILTGGQGGGIQLIRNASATPTAGQSLGSFAWKGVDSANSNVSSEAMIEATAAENFSGSTAATNLLFYTKPTGTGPGSAPSERARFDPSGNLGLGTSSFGTSAAKVLSIGSGVEPSSGPADTVQFYSVDRSAGNTIPAFYCEGSGVTNAGITSTAVTHKIAMKINGTIYYLLATTNAT